MPKPPNDASLPIRVDGTALSLASDDSFLNSILVLLQYS